LTAGLTSELPCDHHLPGAPDHLTPLAQARRIADLAEEKLARDVVTLDMRQACSYTDFFVIATGRNPRQTRAIYNDVREQMKHENGVVPERVTGADGGTWILADYLDVILHVFTPEARDYYRLEDLWADAPSVKVAATV